MRLVWGAAAQQGRGHEWVHDWRLPDGAVWMQVARRGRGYLVRFPARADFEVARRAIVCAPCRGVPAPTVRHLLLDQLLPARLASDRRLVLHASAVAVDGRAIGFVGAAGSGKSTLAAALVRRGAALVTDDALMIEVRGGRLVATPTYPGLRLWPAARKMWTPPGARRCRVAHYTRKERWAGAAVPFCPCAVPLAALYLIAPGTRASARRIGPRQAVMALVRHSMILDVTDRAALRASVDLAAEVASSVHVARLVVPRGRRGVGAACRLAIDEDA